MKIADFLKSGKKSFSFEFFPPKTDEDAAGLMRTAEALKALDPSYISVTWGAGGSTRRKTFDLVCGIKEKLGVETMAHLTCVGASRAEVEAVLVEARAKGIDNILKDLATQRSVPKEFIGHPELFRDNGPLERALPK